MTTAATAAPRAAPAPPRRGCGPRTWPGWPRWGCAPASCGPPCRRWESRSGSPRSSAVLGLSASSQAGLLAEIARLGTNLLTVQNGQTFTGGTAELPATPRR